MHNLRLNNLYTPECLCFFLVLALNGVQIVFTNFGERLLPFEKTSDAQFYLYAAWFDAVFNTNSAVGEVLSISPYRWLLSACFFIFGTYTFIPFVLNGLLSAMTGVFLVLQTRIMFEKRSAWFVALLWPFIGAALFFSGIAVKTTMVVFLQSAAMLCFAIYFNKSKLVWAIAGIIITLGAMIDRPNVFALWIALCLTVIVFVHHKKILSRLLHVAIFAGILLLGSSLSKAFYGDEPSYYSPVGLNIYLGHSKPDNWDLSVEGVRGHIIGHRQDAQAVAEKALGKPLSQAEASAFWIQKALDEAKGNPQQYMKAQLQKSAAFLAPYSLGLPENFLIEREIKPWLYLTFINFSHIFVLALLSIPLFLQAKTEGFTNHQKSLFSFQILCVLGYMASLFITFVSERYRLPVYALIVPLAGFSLSQLQECYLSKKMRKLFIYAVVGLCLYGLTVAIQSYVPNKFFQIYNVSTYVKNLKNYQTDELKYHQARFKFNKTLSSTECHTLLISHQQIFFDGDDIKAAKQFCSALP